MSMIVDVIGIKAFKGVIDGKSIDSAEVYCFVRLDERQNRRDRDGINWKTGHGVESWRLPNSDAGMALMHLKPSMRNPVAMRLEVERLSNGKETREVVIDIQPVSGSVVDQATGEVKPVAVAPVRKAV